MGDYAMEPYPTSKLEFALNKPRKRFVANSVSKRAAFARNPVKGGAFSAQCPANRRIISAPPAQNQRAKY
jgi:hypothetical protein